MLNVHKGFKFLFSIAVMLNGLSNCLAETPRWHPVATLTGGAVFASNAGSSKYIPSNPDNFSFYDYSASDANQTNALIGFFLGTEFLLKPQWSLQTGLGYYQPTTFTAKGIVTQGVDLSSADQYGYQYSIFSRQLLVESKLLYNYNTFHPYVSLGIGAAFNDVDDFNVNIQPPFTTFSNQFSDNDSTSFSYSVGVGIDKDITKVARLGVGYRYADLGKVATGNSMIDTISTSNTLSQSHFYVNEVQVQLTLIIM